MSNFTFKIIKNFFLLLLFTVLSSTLFGKFQEMRVEGAWTGAAYTSVVSVPVVLSPTPILTSTPSPTVVAAVIPTNIHEPTSIPPTATPAMEKPSEINNVAANDLIDKLNQYRRSKGLSEVTSDSKTCELAKVRVREVIFNFSHDGFQQRIDEDTLPYPSYSNVTENIARVGKDSKNVIEMWIDSPPHRENMEKDTPYVCIEQEQDFYVYEGWKP